MLADDRLWLLKTLPEVGNTGILLLNEAENLQAQGMSADFKLLSEYINELSRAAGVFYHIKQFTTIY